MSAPAPPADLASREPLLAALNAGAILHRFHAAGQDPVFFDRSSDGRLNAPDSSYGVLYAARNPRGAFAETFLRSPGRRQVDPGLLSRKAYVRLEVVRPLNLIDFDGPGLAILGATAEVIHGPLPYDLPQSWSKALRSHSVKADGIAYTARHDPHEVCYALFESDPAPVRERDRRSDLDTGWFWELADVYRMGRAP